MALATITTKGQVTIPKSVRDSLLLSTGDKIEFVVTDKREALIRPISKKVDEVFGILHKPGRKTVSIEEINAILKQKMKDNFK
jgi:antitoxin PrlF